MTRTVWIGGLVLILALLVLVLLVWYAQAPTPTRVEVTMTVSRVRLVVGGDRPSPVVDAIGTLSAQLEDFTQISLRAATLQRADPTRIPGSIKTPGKTVWWPRDADSSLTITAGTLPMHTRVTIRPLTQGSDASLKRLFVQPGDSAIFEASGTAEPLLDILLLGKDPIARIDPGPHANVWIDNAATVSSIAPPPATASEWLRVTPAPQQPLIAVKGRDDRLRINLELPPTDGLKAIQNEPIPVTAIDITRQGTHGQALSALLEPATIDYPDVDAPSNRIPAGHFLRLEPDGVFELLGFGLTRVDGHAAIALRLSGLARVARSGTRDFADDHRLSHFERWSRHVTWQVLAALGGALGAVVALLAGIKSLRTEPQDP